MKHKKKPLFIITIMFAVALFIGGQTVTVQAAGKDTQKYIAANNRALINNVTGNDEINMIHYGQDISKYYSGKYYTQTASVETYYTDETLSTVIPRDDGEGHDITNENVLRTYQYDDHGNVTQDVSYDVVDVDGFVHTYTYVYDSHNQIVEYTSGSEMDYGEYSYANKYNKKGQLTESNSAKYTYDKYGRISDITAYDYLYHFTYKNNRIVKIRVSGLTESDRERQYNDHIYTLSYDKSGRLVSAVEGKWQRPQLSLYSFTYNTDNSIASSTSLTSDTWYSINSSDSIPATVVKQTVYAY